ncbi:MAG: hypothetical protein NTW19_00540 [Planctomycetota bacterium]|nr:hypothetical protein [Planctomycetota bacterium]
MITPPLPGASLTQGPSDWQIIQQSPDGHASLALAGVHRTQATEFRVEARIVRENDGAPVTASLDWRPATLLPDQRWELTLDRIPAGGLYRLETRVWRANCPDIRPMRGDYVHHIGVGDIWLVTGQSNASGTGIGFAEDPPTLGVHQLGNDEQWKLASHPLEDATRSRHTATVHGVFQATSPWLAFARRLQRELGHPIALVPTALGGSGVSSWQPGTGNLFANMADMLKLAGGKVRGVVWYQGESDCSAANIAAYPERFRRFVEGVREQAGNPKLPIVTAQLGRFTWGADDAQGNRDWTAMRDTQRRLALEIPHAALVPAIDLPLSDEIHVSAAANLALGERFADAALALAYGRDVAPPGIALKQAAWLTPARDAIRLTFNLGPAGWCSLGPVNDFTVVDAAGATLAIKQVTPNDVGTVDLHLAQPAAPGNVTIHAHAGKYPHPSLRDRDQRPVIGFSVELKA